MMEKMEYQPTKAEVVEAENRLTPEQSVASRARYEIRKHKKVLEQAGMTEEQINEASALASEEAVKEYRTLAEQGPWKRTMTIVEEVKERLSPDEQILIGGITRWSSDFVLRWKERIDIVRTRLGKDASMETLVRDIDQNGAPSGMLQWGEPLRNFPSFLLFGPKVRSLVDPEAQKQRDTAWEQDKRMPVTQPRKPFGQGEPWDEVIHPTKEGIASIFQAFGAEIPEESELSDLEKRGLATRPIQTRFEGVYLALSPTQDVVSVAFDTETLARMIDMGKEPTDADIT